MKKLLPLLFLVACADPNAELLAKYESLKIDRFNQEGKIARLEGIIKQDSFVIGQLQRDMAWYACKEDNLNEYQRKYLCGEK